MKKQKVSDAVIHRLPRYYRCLLRLEEQGTVKISSRELARITAPETALRLVFIGCTLPLPARIRGFAVRIMIQEV